MANKCKPVIVKIKGDMEKVLAAATKEAAKNDIVISGDVNSGKIKHKKVDIWGTYTVKDDKIKIEITEDTFFASCEEIEKGAEAWFKGK